MKKHSLSHSSDSSRSCRTEIVLSKKSPKRRHRRGGENSDVLISAVISTYLLTHLHHVLQRAEYGATKNGKTAQAANFAQLRKLLCMDARSMKDASAIGMRDGEFTNASSQESESKVA